MVTKLLKYGLPWLLAAQGSQMTNQGNLEEPRRVPVPEPEPSEPTRVAENESSNEPNGSNDVVPSDKPKRKKRTQFELLMQDSEKIIGDLPEQRRRGRFCTVVPPGTDPIMENDETLEQEPEKVREGSERSTDDALDKEDGTGDPAAPPVEPVATPRTEVIVGTPRADESEVSITTTPKVTLPKRISSSESTTTELASKLFWQTYQEAKAMSSLSWPWWKPRPDHSPAPKEPRTLRSPRQDTHVPVSEPEIIVLDDESVHGGLNLDENLDREENEFFPEVEFRFDDPPAESSNNFWENYGWDEVGMWRMKNDAMKSFYKTKHDMVDYISEISPPEQHDVDAAVTLAEAGLDHAVSATKAAVSTSSGWTSKLSQSWDNWWNKDSQEEDGQDQGDDQAPRHGHTRTGQPGDQDELLIQWQICVGRNWHCFNHDYQTQLENIWLDAHQKHDLRTIRYLYMDGEAFLLNLYDLK